MTNAESFLHKSRIYYDTGNADLFKGVNRDQEKIDIAFEGENPCKSCTENCCRFPCCLPFNVWFRTVWRNIRKEAKNKA